MVLLYIGSGAIYVAYMTCAIYGVDTLRPLSATQKKEITACIVTLAGLFMFSEVLHPLLFYDHKTGITKLEFLPLLLTSCVCAVVLCWTWWKCFLQLYAA